MDRAEYTRRLDFDEVKYQQLLQSGIAAVKGGDRQQARRLLFKATEMKPSDPSPWLWLSATTDDTDEQRDYLEHAVAADPGNAAARRGLVLLSGKLDASQVLEEGEGISPRRPTQPEEARAIQAFICPHCGGQTHFDTLRSGLLCEYCGYFQQVEPNPAAELSEQVLDFVLPTERGHRWSEAQHSLTCAQCGSVSLLPAGRTSDECPYCGSRRLIESSEKAGLVDVQVIGLAQFDEAGALNHLRQWLGRGWFIPDDLRKLALTSKLRPAYYPFWTFDGTLEMSWSCEVNEGSSNRPKWVPRSGVEYLMFDDELVAGLDALERVGVSKIGPFELKKVVKFKPEYLAGWTALTYNVPLAKASLIARENVARRLRQQLHGRILIGEQKRNLRSGGTKWSGLTFKQVLLPLWVSSYRYRGRTYRVLINGQTGKVVGNKPKDAVKIFGFIASALFTLILIASLSLYLAFNFGWLGR